MKNIEKVFYMICVVVLVLVGTIISGVVSAEENESLESIQKEVNKKGDTAFDFFGLRSGMSPIGCRNFFKYSQDYLELLSPNRYLDVGSSGAYFMGKVIEANGIIKHLRDKESIKLVSIGMFFTGDGVLWKLNAGFSSGNTSIYALAKFEALQTIFPDAEISNSGDGTIIHVVLSDLKIALDAMLKAKYQYIEDLKKASE